MASGREIGDSIMNAAMMASFTIPGDGPFIAAGLAGGQAVFDVFFGDMLDGGGPVQDPGDMTVTANQLQQAINDIKAAITDGQLKSKADTHFTTIDNLFRNNLAPHWNDAAAGRGPAFVGTGKANISEQDWIRDMTKDLSDPITGNSPILDAITFVTDHPSIRWDTIPLLVYAGTAFALFSKINVMWEYARIVRSHDLAKTLNDQKLAAHVKAYRNWMGSDPKTRGPAPSLPPAVEALLPKDEIQQQSHYVADLHRVMDKTLIPHLQSIVDDLQKVFMDAHNEVNNRAMQLVIYNPVNTLNDIHDGGLHDTGTDKKFLFNDCWDPILNDARKDMYLGLLRADIYHRHIEAPGLADFIVDVRLQHKAVLSHWKQCRDNAYKFLQDYPVPSNAKN